ncbi:hypothetical protein [Thiobacillus sp.]
MFWFVMALQAMTPFVHAHAGAGWLGEPGQLHVHPGVYGDVVCHLIEGGEQGALVEVTQGMSLRQAVLLAADAVPNPVSAVLPTGMITSGWHAAWPTAPPLPRLLSDHILPFALAPPLR